MLFRSVFTDDVASVASRELQVLPKALGPRIGSDVQKVIAAVKKGEWSLEEGSPMAAGVRLAEGEYTLRVVAREGTASAALGNTDGVVVLDVVVTPELEAEGQARDLIRSLQQTRRAIGLDVSDRITVNIDAPSGFADRIAPHLDMIAGEVLATSVLFVPGSGDAQHVEGDGADAIRVWVTPGS